MDPLAQGRASRAPGGALALALLLHGLVLWAAWPAAPGSQGLGTTSVVKVPGRLRLLSEPRPAPAPAAPPTTTEQYSTRSSPEEQDRNDATTAVAAATAATGQDAQIVEMGGTDAPLPAYPDAPMPGGGTGELRLRWWLTLDPQGQVLTVEGGAGALTETPAFAKSGNGQLPALRFNAAQLGLAELPTRMCAELRFVEDGSRVELRRLPHADNVKRCIGASTSK